MTRRFGGGAACAFAVAIACVLGSGGAAGQQPGTEGLTRELVGLMDQAKLDSVAAQHPDAPDQFVAALYFPGAQLLVISARYSAPSLLTAKLENKNYREIYLDLNSASEPESRVFIEDRLVDGLRPDSGPGQPFDSFETSKQRVEFDGNWGTQKLSEDDYRAAFTSADAEYRKILNALIGELKG